MESLISIVIPCYNDAEFIQQSIKSALDQTYGNKEIIVVDDGSNAETKKILQQVKPTLGQLITQQNKGQSSARNHGIEKALGKYILVLDSDDYMEPDFCEKAMAIFENENSVRLVTCNARLHFKNGQTQIFKPKGGMLTDFLFSNSALGNCAIFKKIDWEKIGGYDEAMRHGWEDWEFYIRLMELGGNCVVIPEVLFHYRKRKNSTTTTANNNKYQLYNYIFSKHKILYTTHYEQLLNYFLEKLEREEQERERNKKSLNYRLGYSILTPFRFIKKKLT